MEQTGAQRYEIRSEPHWQVYLEIGPGYDPIAAETSLEFTGRKVYIGIEHKPEEYYSDGETIDTEYFSGRQAYLSERRPGERIIFARGDGRSLHLPYGSVHQVYMGNVLNGVSDEDGYQMLREAARVMDGSGPLVLEVGFTDDRDSFIEALRVNLESVGFNSGEVVSESNNPKHWRGLMQMYPSTWPGEHVFVVAYKKVPTV